MISAVRWDHSIDPTRFLGRIGVAALMLSLPVSVARGSQQERINESRASLPTSRSNEFVGEIEYSFDTALNMTRARFSAPLGSRRLLARMFGGPPVHTLVAAYEFAGHVAVDHPDSIRFSLLSDEYADELPDYHPMFDTKPPILEISIGDSIARFPLGIAQKIEVRWAPETYARASHLSPGAEIGTNFYRPVSRVHMHRTATAWLRTCELVALSNRNEVHGVVAGLEFAIGQEVLAGLQRFAEGETPINCPVK